MSLWRFLKKTSAVILGFLLALICVFAGVLLTKKWDFLARYFRNMWRLIKKSLRHKETTQERETRMHRELLDSNDEDIWKDLS